VACARTHARHAIVKVPDSMHAIVKVPHGMHLAPSSNRRQGNHHQKREQMYLLLPTTSATTMSTQGSRICESTRFRPMDSPQCYCSSTMSLVNEAKVLAHNIARLLQSQKHILQLPSETYLIMHSWLLARQPAPNA
jgi:hypothetical protein